MRRIKWCAGGAAILAVGLLVPACSEDGFFQDYTKPFYISGKCGGADEDCHTVYNNIPGSICYQGECICLKGMDQCCPGGEWDESGNPLNCTESDNYRCRPWDECHPSQSEPEPEPEPECITAADCPPPPDLRCGEATCEGGKCGLTIFFPAGKIAWQVLGDCKTAFCDETGNVVLVEDPSDVPKTSDACVVDSCQGPEPKHIPVGEGEACIDTTGLCVTEEISPSLVRKCVDCISPDFSPCAPEQGCWQNKCVPLSCTNGVKDGEESGQDCGGPHCVPCKLNQPCKVSADCEEGTCEGAACVPPRHNDWVKNDGETGIDCGCGEKCLPCPDGEGCIKPENCTSGVCYVGICLAPTCFDMVQNGSEQGVDCGGGCELPCPLQSPPG
jgi:hypothetical protein